MKKKNKVDRLCQVELIHYSWQKELVYKNYVVNFPD